MRPHSLFDETGQIALATAALPSKAAVRAAAIWAAVLPYLMQLATWSGACGFLLGMHLLAAVSAARNALLARTAQRRAAANGTGPPTVTQPTITHSTAAAAGQQAALTAFLREHGSGSLASASTACPEFYHHLTPAGALAYCVASGYGRTVVMAVGDPLAARADWPAVTSSFLTAHPRALFWHVSAEYATVLQKWGLYINLFGAETAIDVQARD